MYLKISLVEPNFPTDSLLDTNFYKGKLTRLFLYVNQIISSPDCGFEATLVAYEAKGEIRQTSIGVFIALLITGTFMEIVAYRKTIPSLTGRVSFLITNFDLECNANFWTDDFFILPY